jgi:lambda family phage portal protein
LQLLESDYCDELQGGDFPMGVKVNQYGKPEAYSFYERHPGSLEGGGAKYQISANDVLHPAYKTRIGQLRGVPKIAPALMRTWQLSKYEEAELIAARQQACAGVFFKKTLPEGWTGEPVDGDLGQVGVVTEPGQGIELPYGVEAQLYNPTHPNSNYTAFTQAQLRALAVCGGVSFHVLSGDLTSVNYSSARIGYLSDQSGWKMLQELLITRVLEPVFNRWLETEVMTGRLPVAFTLPSARAHTWHPKRWVWVDPQAEAAGLAAMLENRLMSPQQAIASGGRDPDEVLRECAAWQAKLDALGVSGGPATTFGAAKPGLAPVPATENDSNDEDGEPDLYAPEEAETETEDAA